MQQPPNPNPQNRQFQQQPPQQSDYTQPQTYYPPQQQWQQPQMPPQQQWNPQQPPFPQPQYPFPPPQYTPPPPAPKKLLRNKWFWIAVIGGLVLISGIAALANGGQSNTALTSNTASATTQPTVHATPVPAKPTPTPTLDQRIHALVSGADKVGSISKIERDSQFITISENAADNLTNGLIVGGIKMDCFNIQKALWTDTTVGKQIPEVVINFYMPVQDQYGNQSIGEVASCDLQKSTAQKFNWNNLTQDDAWNDYDNAHIAPFLTQ